MSTTFGVRIPSTDEVVEIARRVGVGNGNVDVYFTNQIAELLPLELEVIPMDNTAQGVKTIEDLVKLIK